MHEPLVETDTNSAKDSEGGLAGFQGTTFLWIIGMFLICSVVLGIFIFSGIEFNMMILFACCYSPVAVVALLIILFVNGKPPHYAEDTISNLLHGKDFNESPVIEKNTYPIVGFKNKN